jgi:DMSO/TMAO reductase YedYZ molybdopterin-dependent catalytic subunit
VSPESRAPRSTRGAARERAAHLPGHAAERLAVDRPRFLAVAGGSLGALFLAACDSRGPAKAWALLTFAERRNESQERLRLRHSVMDHPPSTAKADGGGFPSYVISDTVPVWDAAARGPWTLEVSGLVRRPLRLTLDALLGLPRVRHRVDHFCVEGWTAVAERAGVRVSELARLAGEAGYMNRKYLTRVVFLPHRNGGYWSDQSYEWYTGT